MTTQNYRLYELLRKHLAEGLNQEELSELRTYDETLVTQSLGELLDAADAQGVIPSSLDVPSERMYSNIIQHPEVDEQLIREPRRGKFRSAMWWMSGAAALLCVGLLLFREHLYHPGPATSAQALADQPIVPGGNKATLTMADGQSIVLQEDQAGIVVSSEAITYQDGSTLLKNKTAPVVGNRHDEYALLSVPQGGTYQITLSDGTAVWLNSASQLRYPPHFGSAERIVYLEGEAFFDVAKQAQPFRVITREQSVEVLGTQFNVSAYAGEPAVQTTLVGGNVRVTNASSQQSSTLTPGQQSSVIGDRMTISAVDVSLFTAWKDGYFAFPDVHIHQALNAIARWYDIDFEYQDDLSDRYFGGTISRFEDFQTLLQTIALTGSVKFEIQGRRVFVMK